MDVMRLRFTIGEKEKRERWKWKMMMTMMNNS
jgi:hypothetical protein